MEVGKNNSSIFLINLLELIIFFWQFGIYLSLKSGEFGPFFSNGKSFA
jgi:hypothetical protein